MKLRPLLVCLLAGLFFACEKDEIPDAPEVIIKEKVEGFVQKGPYINGTSIVISELDQNLVPSGRNFNTQIADNSGNFRLSNIQLSSRYVQLKADGYYFNEVSGSPSASPLTLYALSDLSDKSSINVNILSYLEKARVEFLISEGMAFDEAKRKAQQEILAAFGIEKDNDIQAETLDITREGDEHAILLAISIIFQGQRTVAELSELLANFSTDIRQDGVLNSQSTTLQLVESAKLLNPSSIRTNMINRYAAMGIGVNIPDFEKYVSAFIEFSNYSYAISTTFPFTGEYGLNILKAPHGSYLNTDYQYSFAANVPAGTSLKIVVKGEAGLWHTSANGNDWEVYPYDEGTQSQTILAAQSSNLIDMPFGVTRDGAVTIEVYENNNSTPGITKSFYFKRPEQEVIKYPKYGPYWQRNILDMPSDTTIRSSGYGIGHSITMNKTSEEDYSDEIKVIFEGTGSYSLSPDYETSWSFTQTGNQLLLNYPEGHFTANMVILLQGEGKMTITSKDLNKVIHFKEQ